MHRSRLSTLLIDVPTAHVADAAAFWAAALGTEARAVPGEEQFTSLPDVVAGLVTAVQAVDDEPRYHVDLETDDVEAETARLLALGAVPVSHWMGCEVLRAPGGHLLCVIPLHSDPAEFERTARVWD
ncbi:VOC family protein [Kineococcus glutinatus]|uniref:VOC family protein n=1 Tax=Kineococcus glutinatus TaxID=1070872 RepID=A0ABP9I3A4_9ACTN